MSPDAWVSILLESTDIAASHFMNFVSLLFAYIVAMYVAAARLSRFQVASVTVLYSIFIFLPAASFIRTASAILSAGEELRKVDPVMADTFFPGANFSVPLVTSVVPFLFIAAWILSIVFMVSIRRSNDDA